MAPPNSQIDRIKQSARNQEARRIRVRNLRAENVLVHAKIKIGAGRKRAADKLQIAAGKRRVGVAEVHGIAIFHLECRIAIRVAVIAEIKHRRA